MSGTRLGIAAGLAALAAACGGWGNVETAELDLAIEGAYVTQATQRIDGSVPLVQGRAGWVRVFVTANQANNAWPDVRVTLLEGGVPVTVLMASAQGQPPLEPSEGSMTRTWNVRIPGVEVQPGRSLRIELDPSEEYADRDRTNNVWPASGASVPLDVRAAPVLHVKVVPLEVRSGWGGYWTSSQPSSADLARLAENLRRLFPLGGVVVSLHAPVWTGIDLAIESEPLIPAIEAVIQLRAAEQPADSTVHYVAVLPTEEWIYGYYAGLGELSGWNTALWDYGFEDREPLVPHEIGHNFGLYHTPCSPSGIPIEGLDPGWPSGPGYEGARIGAWGMDVAAGVPVIPSVTFDLMSYCAPVWISDYSYVKALDLREATYATALPAIGAAAGPGVLLSGSLHPSRGGALAEPLLVAEAGRAPTPGADLLEARDAAGALLLAVPFEPRVVDGSPSADLRTFAFSVPLAARAAERIAEVTWTREGRTVARRHVQRVAEPERDPGSGELRAVRPACSGGEP